VQRKVYRRRKEPVTIGTEVWSETVRCALGAITWSWRILNKSIETEPDKAHLVVKSIFLLLNIIVNNDYVYFLFIYCKIYNIIHSLQ
jgi:hypothetical protein